MHIKEAINTSLQGNSNLNLYQEIHYYDYYHPYRGGSNPNFNDFSSKTLALKDKKESAINYFFQFLDPIIEKNYIITVVPSSDPENLYTGIRKLAILLSNNGRIDGTSCLRRHTKVEKKSYGGSRNIDVDLNSIEVINKHLIIGNNILLLDDVTTTGNSLLACQTLLIKFGASGVVKLALGKTI